MEANLREVCEILERRGMPPIEGLEWAESKGILLVALIQAPMGMRVPLPKQWAIDIVTMHAVRWWLSRGGSIGELDIHWEAQDLLGALLDKLDELPTRS